uniref:hypothetical protein n=1 Tax=Lentilactobacillus hilgardii TaxID=1588 RepID=UPI00403FA7A6
MLKKNYSTLALLFASNVLDGGKDIEAVPTQLKEDVKELVKSLEEDTVKDLGGVVSNVGKQFVGEASSADKSSKEVSK